ncbi:CU044_5270 family protein [Actinomadura sp. 6N118]|uniref:CU044_5270 family protein n=1 Tax=Actinomadura sp. 6N118 TaxID=3375151 RepID=UPI0037AD5E55
MDDLKVLRELEADVPPLTASARTAARIRLLATIDGAAARRPARRRPVLFMAVAAALAAGAAAVLLVPGDPATTPPPVQPVSAYEVLETAARTVEAQPETTPRPTQWVYEKSLHAPGNTRRQVHEYWIRFDGRTHASIEAGRLEIKPAIKPGYDDKSPQQLVVYLKKLPRDPEGALQRIYRDFDHYAGADRNDKAFRVISDLLSHNVALPPSVQATLYRATARIPGVAVSKNATDAAGRPAVAVTREGDGVRGEVLLARGSYRFLGFRMTTTREQKRSIRGESAVLPKGTVRMNVARLAYGIVDKPGGRP